MEVMGNADELFDLNTVEGTVKIVLAEGAGVIFTTETSACTDGADVFSPLRLISKHKPRPGMVFRLRVEQKQDGRWRAKEGTFVSKESSNHASNTKQASSVTLDLFYRTTEVDRNKATGEVLYKLLNKFGELVQYVVTRAESDLVTRQLGHVSDAEARLAIGRPLQKIATEGVKTNDPEQKRQEREMMKGKTAGGGK